MRYRFSCLLAALLAISACEQTPEPPLPKLAVYQAPVAGAKVDPITTNTIAPPPGMGSSGGFVAGSSVRVGLLLPLTGRSAALGKAMQDAATVSLFDRYAQLPTQQASVKVDLLPKDTGDTAEQAMAAMNAAIAEGANVIIGPVFGDATSAAAPVAQAKQVNVISLSNDNSRGGRGVFMFGFSPQEQASRVVDYAVGAGKTRIAALVPDTPLGNLVLDSAKKTLERRGMTLVREVKYAPQGTGIDVAANTLVKTVGAPDFEALLLPEGGAPLGTILRALSARGINSGTVQLLGTGIWDDAALVRKVPLEGAWLASSMPTNSQLFENRFRSTYNYSPPRIASLAYDAVALAVTIGTSGRPFDVPTLTGRGGFAGPANGIFRLNPDGHVERGLAVLQVQAGTFKVLSPAPSGFGQ